MLPRAVMTAGILMAVLSACDGGSSEPAPPKKVTSVRVTSQYIEGLKALSEMNRGLALRRAVQDSGESCKRVESSGFQEDYGNLSMWTARCSDKKDWALFIAPNGDVQVRSCGDAQELGLPACRFEENPAP